MKLGIILFFLSAIGCTSGPSLPNDFNGKAAVVMGYSTDWVEGGQGGNIYTGMTLDRVNNTLLERELNRYDYVLVEPGNVRLQGLCWWRLRGVMSMEDDLLEPVDYHFFAKADHIYTLSLQMDDYKVKCDVDNFAQPK